MSFIVQQISFSALFCAHVVDFLAPNNKIRTPPNPPDFQNHGSNSHAWTPQIPAEKGVTHRFPNPIVLRVQGDGYGGYQWGVLNMTRNPTDINLESRLFMFLKNRWQKSIFFSGFLAAAHFFAGFLTA